ncbi:MAG: DNA repair protein RecO [Ignavibacteria bacterium]|nr:DNA repair protein RecO [Ignavibacteria bacterium]
MIISAESIVLHSRRYGDSSRIVTLYTRELGKVSVVAKGARTTKSTIGAALEPLSHCRCTIYHGKNKELHTLSQAETITKRRNVSTLEHLQAGLLMCESIVRTQPQEQADVGTFVLLAKALEVLDSVEAQLAYSVTVAMRCRLAEVMGFGIQFVPPSEHASVVVDVTYGSIALAGVGIQLSKNAYDALYASRRGHWNTIADADMLEIESLLSLYFSHHLERRIVSQTYSHLR